MARFAANACSVSSALKPLPRRLFPRFSCYDVEDASSRLGAYEAVLRCSPRVILRRRAKHVEGNGQQVLKSPRLIIDAASLDIISPRPATPISRAGFAEIRHSLPSFEVYSRVKSSARPRLQRVAAAGHARGFDFMTSRVPMGDTDYA